ncbi:hypothetical protein CFP56_007138 [Quercus suber]|uniref:Sieve element occlusion N-terminal domain-containing protein n=1 Tax=Quercus suber TaxID=58331 RepID=A0AAW0L8V9_QUESU
MASNALGSSQQSNKGGLSLFTLSEQEILNQIYSTHHVHDDEKFDVESLFIIVENILKRATVVVDNVVLGTHATVEDLEEKTPKQVLVHPYVHSRIFPVR